MFINFKQRISTLISNLTSPSKLRFFSIAVIFIIVGIYVTHHARADRLVNEKGVVQGRDFMAFYTAGKMINEGNGKELYNPIIQYKTQHEILAGENWKGLNYYISPASVAVLYSIFARFPYLIVFHVHTLLMTGFFLTGIFFLKPHLNHMPKSWGIIGLLGMIWLPMSHTIMAGQNAALVFMLLSLAYSATLGNQSWKAGLALGLLLFKPQFAMPLLGLLMLQKHYLTIIAALLVAIGHYLLGGFYCGWDWPIKMASAISTFYSPEEKIASGFSHISILEVLNYSIISPWERIGANSWIIDSIKACGYGLILIFVGYLIWICRKTNINKPNYALFWAMTISANLLISLHTQYYDVAILLLPILLIVNHQLKNGQPITPFQRFILMLVFFSFPIYNISKLIGFQPLILLPIGIFYLAKKLFYKDLKPVVSVCPAPLRAEKG